MVALVDPVLGAVAEERIVKAGPLAVGYRSGKLHIKLLSNLFCTERVVISSQVLTQVLHGYTSRQCHVGRFQNAIAAHARWLGECLGHATRQVVVGVTVAERDVVGWGMEHGWRQHQLGVGVGFWLRQRNRHGDAYEDSRQENVGEQRLQVALGVVETFEEKRVELLPSLHAGVHFGGGAHMVRPRLAAHGLDLGSARWNTLVAGYLLDVFR